MGFQWEDRLMSDQHVTAQVVTLFTQAANGGGAQFLSQKSEL